jgi:hypothetical protein
VQRKPRRYRQLCVVANSEARFLDYHCVYEAESPKNQIEAENNSATRQSTPQKKISQKNSCGQKAKGPRT